MRTGLGLVAAGLAGIAAIVATLEGDMDVALFYAIPVLAAVVVAWAARPPFVGVRRRLAQAIALLWLALAVSSCVGLAIILTQPPGTLPPLPPENLYLGIEAIAYLMLGFYAGSVLLPLLVFRRQGPRDP